MYEYVWNMEDDLIFELFSNVFENEYSQINEFRVNRYSHNGFYILSVHFKGGIVGDDGISVNWTNEVFELNDSHIKPVEYFYYNNEHSKRWGTLLYNMYGVEYLEYLMNNMN